MTNRIMVPKQPQPAFLAPQPAINALNKSFIAFFPKYKTSASYNKLFYKILNKKVSHRSHFCNPSTFPEFGRILRGS